MNTFTQSDFRVKVNECLDKAQGIYGVDFGRVTITFDLKGASCGEASMRPHPNLGRTFLLRFHKEALKKDWDMMVSSTIPHEVAHLVAFACPALRARDHNRAWKQIAIKLGDSEMGAVYHTLDLARRKKFFIYDVASNRLKLNAKQHRAIQRGEAYACSRTKTPIKKEDFVGVDFEGD